MDVKEGGIYSNKNDEIFIVLGFTKPREFEFICELTLRLYHSNFYTHQQIEEYIEKNFEKIDNRKFGLKKVNLSIIAISRIVSHGYLGQINNNLLKKIKKKVMMQYDLRWKK